MIDSKETISVVVTYNRLNLLKECIEALLKSSVKNDILIINNCSTDGTYDFLQNIEKELFIYNVKLKIIDIKSIGEIDYKNEPNSYIYVYNSSVNLGGAGGYNIGVRIATKLKYKYLWLMDDDTIVYENSLFELYNVKNKLNDDFGFLSSKVLWKDLNICKTNVQRKKVAKKIKNFDDEIVSVDYSSFVSFFIKSEDVLKLGLPIKDFFIWSDDLEYTRRFSNYKKSYLCNKSVVIHKCMENIGVDITKDKPDRLDRYKYIYRNDVYVFKKEGIQGIMFLILRYIYHILKILFNSKNKIKKISIMTKGNIEGIFFNPKIEYI